MCLPKCEHFKHKNPLFGLNDWNIVIEKLMIVRKEVDLFDRIYLAYNYFILLMIPQTLKGLEKLGTFDGG